MNGKLVDRSILSVTGDEAEGFLDNLVTCQVIGLSEGEARFGALLTPQGKILFDFFLIKQGDGFLLDCPDTLGDDLLKRLVFYRLRAKVEITKDENTCIMWSQKPVEDGDGFVIADPRHESLGFRSYLTKDDMPPADGYDELRISLGVPEGGQDFDYGAVWPHEVLMDQYGGIDFKKGCYVGQEVVSRMQHRGTTKKRIVHVASETALPETRTEILADEKPAGILGSTDGNNGLALLRLDRAMNAKNLIAGETRVHAAIPDWASFNWPGKE